MAAVHSAFNVPAIGWLRFSGRRPCCRRPGPDLYAQTEAGLGPSGITTTGPPRISRSLVDEHLALRGGTGAFGELCGLIPSQHCWFRVAEFLPSLQTRPSYDLTRTARSSSELGIRFDSFKRSKEGVAPGRLRFVGESASPSRGTHKPRVSNGRTTWRGPPLFR